MSEGCCTARRKSAPTPPALHGWRHVLGWRRFGPDQPFPERVWRKPHLKSDNFSSEVGSPVATSVLHRASSIAARKVDTSATPHDLRHYFASVQIAGGCSIKKLQHLLGYKSATETWDTDGHLMGDEDDLSRAVMHAALGSPLAQLRPAGNHITAGQRPGSG